MYPIPGHAAMSLFGTYLARVPITPALVATVVPDVVDKLLKDILDVTPYGRCWMHTLLAVALCTWLVTWWKGREWGLSWFLGHFLHLIGDIGFIPWFYPFISYHWPDAPNIVMAAAEGMKETVTGSGPSQGYSKEVKSVFVGHLIYIESIILMPMLLLYTWPAMQKKPWQIILLSIALAAILFRLIYDFPALLFSVADILGDWVLIRS